MPLHIIQFGGVEFVAIFSIKKDPLQDYGQNNIDLIVGVIISFNVAVEQM